MHKHPQEGIKVRLKSVCTLLEAFTTNSEMLMDAYESLQLSPSEGHSL